MKLLSCQRRINDQYLYKISSCNCFTRSKKDSPQSYLFLLALDDMKTIFMKNSSMWTTIISVFWLLYWKLKVKYMVINLRTEADRVSLQTRERIFLFFSQPYCQSNIYCSTTNKFSEKPIKCWTNILRIAMVSQNLSVSPTHQIEPCSNQH